MVVHALLAAGALLYTSSRFGTYVAPAAMYHALVWGTFYMIYVTLPGGFESHFGVPDDKKRFNHVDIGYFASVTHAGVGYGDVYPKTTGARVLVTCHILLAMMATFRVLAMHGA